MSDTQQNTLKKWDEQDRINWLAEQKIKRSYMDDVVTRLKALNIDFDVEDLQVVHILYLMLQH